MPFPGLYLLLKDKKNKKKRNEKMSCLFICKHVCCKTCQMSRLFLLSCRPVVVLPSPGGVEFLVGSSLCVSTDTAPAHHFCLRGYCNDCNAYLTHTGLCLSTPKACVGFLHSSHMRRVQYLLHAVEGVIVVFVHIWLLRLFLISTLLSELIYNLWVMFCEPEDDDDDDVYKGPKETGRGPKRP